MYYKRTTFKFGNKLLFNNVEIMSAIIFRRPFLVKRYHNITAHKSQELFAAALRMIDFLSEIKQYKPKTQLF